MNEEVTPVRIAIVQAMCGHLTCVGPNDFKAREYSSAMNAAISFHIEAGYMPAAQYWIKATIPARPAVPVLAAALSDEGNAK